MATAKKKSTPAKKSSSFVGYGTNVKAGKKISAGVQKKVVKGVKSGATTMGATRKEPRGENWLEGTGLSNINSVAAKRIWNQLIIRGQQNAARDPKRSAKNQGMYGYNRYVGKTKNKRG